jgi:hypothetical protein
MKEGEPTLRDIFHRIHAVEGKLDALLERLAPLLNRLEQAEDTLTRNLSVPRDFNEGPHLPGLG